MHVSFLLNGEEVQTDVAPDTSLLDWLRLERGLTGTKEGCNEGDCGACTVMVTDQAGPRALNACLLFVPQLAGKAVRTVEGIAAPDGALHPVQEAMVAHHGSQCGFCTPGIVVSLAVGHLQGRTDHDEVLSGNLCRCTGYAPIIRAAEAATTAPAPPHLREKAPSAGTPTPNTPESLDDFAAWYVDNPDATLIAGATDAGLWVTKQLRDLPKITYLGRIAALNRVSEQGGWLRLGAGVTLDRMTELMCARHPSYGAMLRRFASVQIRAAATIGGSLANASPIGDNAPPLIALGARLHLRRGAEQREMLLEDFFIAYGKQDRQPGEFVEAVSLPAAAPALRVWKISKRFDQDISAVLGAFNLDIEGGSVASAKVAFGGMAATPKRAAGFEAALIGQPWSEAALEAALPALDADFAPLSDMRASSAYRSETARALARRYFAAMAGHEEGVRA